MGSTPQNSVLPGIGRDGELLVVDLHDGQNTVVALVPDDPRANSIASSMHCLRVYTSVGTTICMHVGGVGQAYVADVIGPSGQTVRSVPLPGVPSRARVSPSGHLVAWTSFVTGDSYSVPGGFSTRTGILDLRTGELIESIEGFAAEVDGHKVTAPDMNYWGVTFAADDRTFYATLASANRTWLVQGDLVGKTVRGIHRDVECPSLSPDGTRIAFKKRSSRLGPWTLTVLDLATRTETSLPGTVGVDDQAEWLDDSRLVFGVPGSSGRAATLFVVAADGSATATVLAREAASPTLAGDRG